MKLFYLITFTFLTTCYSCSTNSDIEINSISNATYISRTGKVDRTMIDNIKESVSENDYPFKVDYININDSIVAYTEHKEYGRMTIDYYISSKTKHNSELNCSSKLIIHQNEFKFTFCISDVLNYIKNSNKDVAYRPIFEKIKELLNYKKKENDIEHLDYILFNLISNIKFNAYDKFQKKIFQK